ncbi:AAA family ATPase [Nocardia sp. NRRL S-836]|uniref:ATP-binding protein n=1 Tax=Nocardia sp. NRRL S-836 TaxID=1519492 RepID=UPI0006AEE8D5|nr:LuxR family transcriptional regulator [Nocardia sp. NRRL S-836]KOV78040.1 hypothetical protein ADL03_41115 [Nocardia sp. NRRL S-836]
MRAGDATTRTIFGRSKELRAISQVVKEVSRGLSRVVEVVGEPGIGKTRLLVELHRDAAASRMTVLAGRSSEADRHVPFALFTDAIDQHLAGLPPAERERLAADPALGAVFPHLTGGPAHRPVDRREFFRAVRDMLSALAGGTGLALVLDDVHWADQESAELLAHLVWHPPAGPVLLALAHRPKQAVPALSAALSLLARQGLVQTLDLKPLEPCASDEMLDALAPSAGPGLRAALHRASGGNPFYLEVLASRWNGDQQQHEPDGPCPRLTATLHAELCALPEQTRTAAQAAAVLGDPFDVDLVGEVTGLPLAAVFTAMDELAARDVVRQLGTSSRFAFRHPVVRHVTYRTMGAGARIAAHAKATAVLGRRGASSRLLAPHLDRTASVGDVAAVAVLVEAAESAVHRDPGIAAQWLRTAARLLPDRREHVADRRRVLLALSEALARDGKLVESESVAAEVAPLLDESDLQARGRLARLRAANSRLLGGPAPNAEAEKLIAAVDESAVGVALRVEIAIDELLSGARVDPAALVHVLDATERLGDQGQRATALAAAGLAAIGASMFDEAEQFATTASELFEQLPDGELLTWLDGVVWLCWCLVYLGDPVVAQRLADRVVGLARTSGRTPDLPRLFTTASSAHLAAGAVGTAARLADEGAERGTQLPGTRLGAMTLTAQCRALTWQGKSERALEAGLAATRSAGSVRELWRSFAWMALAEARLLAGDAQGCADAIDAAGFAQLYPALRAEAAEMMVRACLLLGDTHAAREWSETMRDNDERYAGLFALAQAQVLVDTDPNAAAARAAAAEQAFLCRGSRLLAGRARLVAANALAAAGKRAKAAAELFRAEQLLIECGALPLLDQVAADQRRLARIRPAPEAAGLDALTTREKQVAGLVTNGHTNRQIAQRLGVSDKTVEAHLARVFSKLGVGSRAAVASAVARLRAVGGLLGEGA